MAGPVVITYLELAEPDPLRPPSRPAPEGFSTREVHDPGVNRDLYRGVGGDYQWVDRLPWSDERWASTPVASRPTWSSSTAAPPATWSSSSTRADSAKIALFGLLSEFHGIGLGGHALTAALTRARELRPRVWLTTCTLDGPYALPNYRARGMRAVPHRDGARARRATRYGR